VEEEALMWISVDGLHAVRRGFGNARALVVGDLMLDRYLWGEVTRISPEAPVPIVRLLHTSLAAGGAANVALNLARLGLQVTVAGWIGEDSEGRALLQLLRAAGIGDAPVQVSAERATITKTRIMGGKQQMLRLDIEETAPVAELCERSFVAAIKAELQRDPAVLILSDYAKGTLSTDVCRMLIDMARERDIPVVVDPKGRDYRKYAGATVLTPNRAELVAATGMQADELGPLLEAGARLRADLDLSSLVITRGEEGMTHIRPGVVEHYPAVAREVFDVSGAGDTVVAVLGAGLAAGLEMTEALRISNIAAGVVVGKVGTTPISLAELNQSLEATGEPRVPGATMDLPAGQLTAQSLDGDAGLRLSSMSIES
jgi:D-beta-D-heptose 7-phosphate kinase/D-beta-D-heptose 1-phosphate adenosyltransferase